MAASIMRGGRASEGTVGIQETAGSRGVAGTREGLGQAWGLRCCGITGLTVGFGGTAEDAVGYQVMENCIICMAHRTVFWALEKEAQVGVLGVRQRCQRSQSNGTRQRGSQQGRSSAGVCQHYVKERYGSNLLTACTCCLLCFKQ